MLASIMQHKEDLKGLAGESNMITIALLQYADVLGMISDTLKSWGKNVKEQHEIMEKVSM